MSVSGIDAIVERVVKLGATVVSPPAGCGGGIVRIATIHDTQGAELTVGTDDPSVRVTR